MSSLPWWFLHFVESISTHPPCLTFTCLAMGISHNLQQWLHLWLGDRNSFHWIYNIYCLLEEYKYAVLALPYSRSTINTSISYSYSGIITSGFFQWTLFSKIILYGKWTGSVSVEWRLWLSNASFLFVVVYEYLYLNTLMLLWKDCSSNSLQPLLFHSCDSLYKEERLCAGCLYWEVVGRVQLISWGKGSVCYENILVTQ